jgi:acid phosphatase
MKQTRREFVRTLFVATQAAAIGGLLPARLLAADSPRSLNFLAFGDWGRNGEKDQMEVAKQMGIAAATTRAQFIVSVGDNFYENGVASVDDAQWKTSFEDVYTAAALQVPWRVVLGNHDYHGNTAAQIEYSKHSPRWTMPAPYYQRTETIDESTAADFFYIDTDPMQRKNAKTIAPQMAWLESALRNSQAPWKIAIGHHPIYSGGEHGDTPYLVSHVLPLFEKYGVQVYFNGHDHDLQHLQAGRVNLFCTGAGSKPRSTTRTTHTLFAKGSCSGFVAVSLLAETMTVQMLDDRGAVLHSANIRRA